MTFPGAQTVILLLHNSVVSLPDQYGSSTELIRSLPDVYLVYRTITCHMLHVDTISVL